MSKTVLITGASSGIGFKAAEKFLNAGFEVYVAARRVERLDGLVEKGAKAVKLDVTDEESMRKAVEKINTDSQGVDILVNNAGYGEFGAFEEVSIERAKYQFEVNVFGLARMTQLVLPHMRKNNSGRIINISSIAGTMWTPLGAWYDATKHSVEVISKVLRSEVKRFGIKVSVIQPGAINTEWLDVAMETLNKSTEIYTQEAQNLEKSFRNSYKNAPGPEVVAKAVFKAGVKSRPKKAYTVPFSSKLMIIMIKMMPESWLNRIFGSFIK